MTHFLWLLVHRLPEYLFLSDLSWLLNWSSLHHWLRFSSGILNLMLNIFHNLRLLSNRRLEQRILSLETSNKIRLFSPRVFSHELIDNHGGFEIGYILPLVRFHKVADLGFDEVLDPHIIWSRLASLVSFHARFLAHHFI